MTLNLQQIPYIDPLVRIQVMPQAHWTDATQPWVDLPMAPRRDMLGIKYWGQQHGVELQMTERASLPDIAAAVFFMDVGTINGTEYTLNDNGNILSAWDLLLGYAGYDIRISLAPACDADDSSGFVPAWKTVFLGTVIAQDDIVFAGDGVTGGRRTWRCSDLLWRTSRWPMNRHSNYMDGSQENHVEGHPGYNFAVQGYYRRLIGNREITNVVSLDPYGDAGAFINNYFCHTFAGIGAGTTWTDLQSVNHALICSRAKGEPLLQMFGATSLLSLGKFVWQVNEAEPCWEFINRVLNRKRGRGISYLDWTEDVGAPFNVHPRITISAQTAADITATPPVGPPIVFPGAFTNGTDVSVDVRGDQRVPDDQISFQYNDTGTCDYLESEGEQLELLVTLSYGDGTLAKRWDAGDEAAFAALDPAKTWLRNSGRWQYVWQRWGIPTNFLWFVKDGNNGADKANHKCNWYCQDDGNFALGDPSMPSKSNSKVMARIMSDLPLYEGYDYTANALTRYDGVAQASEMYAPSRLRPIIMINQNQGVAAATYVDAVISVGAGLANDDFGVLIISGDQSVGQRPFSGVNGAAAGAFAPATLTLTVGLQLSTRVRMASAKIDPLTTLPYIREAAPRRRSLRFPGIFLWLADPGAIWTIYDGASGIPAQAPLRLCAGATISVDGLTVTPGILRDDRNSLAQLHALAWSWFQTPHWTGQWSMRACGLLPSFKNSVGADILYPTIGKVLTTFQAAASFNPVTPITRVRFDAQAGTTTWVVDWNDLDLT